MSVKGIPIVRGFILGFLIWLSFWLPATGQTIVSTGTGFYVNDEGWVLTNAHVVEDCGRVRANGIDSVGTPLLDLSSDLALIHFPAPPRVNHLTFRGIPARLAEPLTALGYPLSDLLSESVKATDGSVSSLAGLGNNLAYMQISAPIQPGNSGGPVIDEAGRVIGIATATLSEAGYDRAQNVNFAIKAEILIAFLIGSNIDYSVEYSIAEVVDPLQAVEYAASSTVYITCHLEGGGSTTPQIEPNELVSPTPALNTFSAFSGYDSIGYDIATIRDTSILSCSAACSAERTCLAFTFNLRHRVCFLKSNSGILILNSDAYSEIATSLVPELYVSNMIVQANTDSPGGDYERLRNSDFLSCLFECGTDLRCRAFSFVRESRDCWLKDRIMGVVTMPGVEFGSLPRN